MTIEINSTNDLLLHWPTLQHEQGNFELIIKQQLENASHDLGQQESISNPDDSELPQAEASAQKHSSNSSMQSIHPPIVTTAKDQIIHTRSVDTDILRHVSGTQGTVKSASKIMSAPASSVSFFDLPRTPNTQPLQQATYSVRPNQLEANIDFKPNNVLVIHSERTIRLYIRDFFADENELAVWAENHLKSIEKAEQAYTQIYINGKPFLVDGRKPIQEEFSNGN